MQKEWKSAPPQLLTIWNLKKFRPKHSYFDLTVSSTTASLNNLVMAREQNINPRQAGHYAFQFRFLR